MSDVDVTNQVDFGSPDDELLPLTQCVCGTKFNLWTFNISIYRDHPYTCPSCGRELYFSNAIHVYQKDSDGKI